MNDNEFKGELFANLRRVVNIVDELRDCGLQQYIDLPSIAVLGQQSCGKSSVLESIVGLDFLPRGEGIVTRRPAELRLNHLRNGHQKPWAVFEEIKGQKFYDFDQVRKTIAELTDKECGNNRGIIDRPIVINIFSPTCPDLTLIDLPGITKNPVGDQPHNIEEIIKNMCLKYVSNPKTIILAVCPATDDLANSEALKIARDLDREGKRTVGVVTKIDNMDEGTNAKDKLLGKDIPLRLGYVGVKNRSQRDINENVRVNNSLDVEKEFFAKHPVYRTMPPGYLGTDVLTEKLTKILYRHIKNYLPELLREIDGKLKESKERLKDLGDSMPIDKVGKMQLLWSMATDFAETFKNTIKGNYDSRRAGLSTRELSGGAKIKLLFNDLLKDFSNDYRCTTEYTDREIERAIKIHEGDSIPGFPSVDAFIYLIKPQIEKIRDPAMETLNDVYMYLESLASKIINKVFYRAPTVIPEMLDTVSAIICKERDHCKSIVEAYIESEDYIFTNDNDYLRLRTDMIPENNKKGPSKKDTDMTEVFVRELRSRIDSYFSLAIRNARDTIPKTIGYFLVRAVQDKIMMELYDHINKKQEIINALSEPEHVTHERVQLHKLIDTLSKAHAVMRRDPNLLQSGMDEMFEADQSGKQFEDTKVERRAAAAKEQTQTAATKTQSPEPVKKTVVEEKKAPVAEKRAIVEKKDTSSLFGSVSKKKEEPAPTTSSKFENPLGGSTTASGSSSSGGGSVASARSKFSRSSMFGNDAEEDSSASSDAPSGRASTKKKNVTLF